MEQREKYLVIFLAVALVGAGLYYGYTYFYDNYTNWGKEIDDNVKRIMDAQTKAARLNQLIDDVSQTSKELAIARRKLPEEGEFYQLLSRLEQEAQNSDIPDHKIIQFNRGNVRNRKMVKVMTISSQFKEITLANLTQMLWRFDNIERLIDINMFKLNPVETSDNSFRFNLDMSLSVYILKQDVASGSSEEA